MVRKLIFIIILIYFSISCTKRDNLELSILSNELVTYEYGSLKDTINLVQFCIENKSSNKYYICNMPEIESDSIYSTNNVYKNGLYFKIYNKLTNKEVDYNENLYSNFFDSKNQTLCDSIFSLNTLRIKNIEYKRMGYKNNSSYFLTNQYRQSNFINPNEKIYGQLYLNITDTMRFEEARSGFAIVKKNNNYYAQILLPSDSTNYQQKLPDYILKRIKNNEYKVFHGVIKSKNKVPVRIIE